jgi:hypothetical protein
MLVIFHPHSDYCTCSVDCRILFTRSADVDFLMWLRVEHFVWIGLLSLLRGLSYLRSPSDYLIWWGFSCVITVVCGAIILNQIGTPVWWVRDLIADVDFHMWLYNFVVHLKFRLNAWLLLLCSTLLHLRPPLVFQLMWIIIFVILIGCNAFRVNWIATPN